MQAIDALLSRNSVNRLAEPAPRGAERETIFQAALRAPDHAWLRPWRFLVIEGAARAELGTAMLEAAREQNPGLDPEQARKVLAKPLRAPLLVAVAAKIQDHPKVPETEQLLSAGCAALNMLHAAHALGFGAIWRSGSLMYHPLLHRRLGLDPARERLVGILYIGSVIGEPKSLPELDSADFFSSWPT